MREPLFRLRLRVSELERIAAELKAELERTRKERDSYERKYMGQLEQNNTLWNKAMTLKGGVEAFRSLKH